MTIPPTFSDELTQTIADFLIGVGIPVTRAELGDDTFLPGILVHDGGLAVDAGRLRYPGDLLHEAGHLAVLPGSVRSTCGDLAAAPISGPRRIEVVAIAWSYAATLELGLDPAIVFHDHGYQGQSASLLMTFRLGVYPGVDGLLASGMTLTPQLAERLGIAPYPRMIKWLRD